MIKLFYYIVPFAILFLPSLWVNYILKKYNKVLSDMPFTGRELGIKILEQYKINNVSINPIKQLDHYNPKEKKIHISTDKLDKKSITSIAVVAHEIGHAIQDKEKYKPLILRQSLIEKTMIFQRIGSFLLIIGLPSIFAFTKSPFYISLISVLLNIFISVYYFSEIGFIIIPIATSISSWFNSILLFLFLKNRQLFYFNQKFFIKFTKIFFASILMGLFFNFLLNFFQNELAYNETIKSLYLVLSVILGLLFYLLICFFIKAFQIKDIKLKY